MVCQHLRFFPEFRAAFSDLRNGTVTALFSAFRASISKKVKAQLSLGPDISWKVDQYEFLLQKLKGIPNKDGVENRAVLENLQLCNYHCRVSNFVIQKNFRL